MKKVIFFIILGFLVSGRSAQSAWPADSSAITRSWLRQEFELAKENRAKVAELISWIGRAGILEKKDCPAFVTAYYGALKTLEAKHGRNPLGKWASLQTGLQLLDQAVSQAPGDMEVRFVRFATLVNLPAFLTDKKKRAADLEQVYEMITAKNFSVVDRATQAGMIDFLLKSGSLLDGQGKVLRTLHPELVVR